MLLRRHCDDVRVHRVAHFVGRLDVASTGHSSHGYRLVAAMLRRRLLVLLLLLLLSVVRRFSHGHCAGHLLLRIISKRVLIRLDFFSQIMCGKYLGRSATAGGYEQRRRFRVRVDWSSRRWRIVSHSTLWLRRWLLLLRRLLLLLLLRRRNQSFGVAGRASTVIVEAIGAI